MAKRGKSYQKIAQLRDKKVVLIWEEAVNWVKNNTYVRFDSTIDLSLKLGMKKSSIVRDFVILPHVFGKSKRILVLTKGEANIAQALEAGADYAGEVEYIEKIKGGWLDFDVVIASPDMMKEVGPLGMILGRRGLMPNPRNKTITTNVGQAVKDFKKGRSEYRSNKEGILHFSVGKASMPQEHILSNIDCFMKELKTKKPVDLKGEFILNVHMSSSMGPSVLVEFSNPVKVGV